MQARHPLSPQHRFHPILHRAAAFPIAGRDIERRWVAGISEVFEASDMLTDRRLRQARRIPGSSDLVAMLRSCHPVHVAYHRSNGVASPGGPEWCLFCHTPGARR
jgi:hypothetical protein